ncbi:MAG: hypothetical protein KF715_08250 [Candidatus Didemnitutus sp.]|nr:hypothetical protein [Candidatus Didemnitutus sp.]
MKTRFVLLVVLALGFGQLSAQTPKPGSTTKTTTKTDDKKTEAKIAGIVIVRPNGTFLGLTLEGGTFKLSFYDKDKKSAPADVTRAAARWNPNYKLGSERIILNLSGDGKALVGSKPVRPPYAFKLFLTLLKGAVSADGSEAEQAVENYTIDFHA